MQVAAWWAEQKLDDFAAIVQPFFSGATAANLSIDFLSDVKIVYNHHCILVPPLPPPPSPQLDCFHPSLIAHQNMAKALWNNMLTPAAKKRSSFDFAEPFVCPTNTTLLYTD